MARAAGIPNRNKQALISLLQAKYPGYQPVLSLAAIANNDVECEICKGEGHTFTNDIKEECEVCFGTGNMPITLDMRFNAHKEVAQYITPKLKAIEVTVDGDLDISSSIAVEFINAAKD